MKGCGNDASSIRAMLVGKSIRLPRIGKGQVPMQVPSTILAECLWHGIQHLTDEVESLDKVDSGRCAYLIGRCEVALLMHYHLLGYADSDARGLVYEYLESLKERRET